MQIIQLADFHLHRQGNPDWLKRKLDELYLAVAGDLLPQEHLVLCLLGDIVDLGDANLYASAVSAIQYLSSKFVDCASYEIICVPGNHDLCDCPYFPDRQRICKIKKCSLNNFFTFCKEIGADSCYDHNFSLHECAGVNMLLVNSVFQHDCNRGQIDLNFVGLPQSKPTLILTHHSFLHKRSSEESRLHQINTFLDQTQNNNIIAVLHGHNHACTDLALKNGCRLLGTGPFSEIITRYCPQFNLISLAPSGLLKIRHFCLPDR